MAKIEGEDCKRNRATYRGENLYITVSPERIDLSMSNIDEFRTLAGLALVERFINELLGHGESLEHIAGILCQNTGSILHEQKLRVARWSWRDSCKQCYTPTTKHRPARFLLCKASRNVNVFLLKDKIYLFFS